jgi:pectate lyase
LLFVIVAVFATGSAWGQAARDLAREALPPGDGWAAEGGGTTGGAAAGQVFTVTSRSELVKALGGTNETNGSNAAPKIVLVKGTIDVNVDDADRQLDAAGYKDPAYDFQAYLKQYAPEAWGRDKKVSGPLEDARLRSRKEQEKRIVINVGANTTIVGLGGDARIAGASLKMEKVDNVIIRSIELEAPIDLFPQWDPTDGSAGNWNSEYDVITIRQATRIWIDHCTFTDGAHPDSASGTYFGRKYQQHDGLLDITNTADFVTVSWCVFRDHDKVALIGSSDSRTSDAGHLRVTMHHNLFSNVTQRLPRVRFGEVHVYNNAYEAAGGSEYRFSYAWGVGVASRLYAENNVFSGVDPAAIIDIYKGTAIRETGTVVDGSLVTDLVERANVAKKGNLTRDVGWTPALHGKIDPTADVAALVKANAGSGKLR